MNTPKPPMNLLRKRLAELAEKRRENTRRAKPNQPGYMRQTTLIAANKKDEADASEE